MVVSDATVTPLDAVVALPIELDIKSSGARVSRIGAIVYVTLALS
jgi:hypothetical protein